MHKLALLSILNHLERNATVLYWLAICKLSKARRTGDQFMLDIILLLCLHLVSEIHDYRPGFRFLPQIAPSPRFWCDPNKIFHNTLLSIEQGHTYVNVFRGRVHWVALKCTSFAYARIFCDF